MNICLANWAYIATIVLAVAAILAVFFAWRNIGVLREQNRRNTFLSLMVDIAETEAREYRAILHKIFDKSTQEGISPNEDGEYPKRIADFFIANGGGSFIWKKDDLTIGSLRTVYCKMRDELKPRITDVEANRKFRAAFEETIALFDRVGFFLLYGDSSLREEAPLWIWDMTAGMWKYLGDYIENRQKHNDGKEKNFAKYFRELASIAKKQV